MTQPMPGKPAEDAENELDIRGLFRTLWAGKLWIIGMGLAFALIALAYTFFARQEWSSTAITDRPTVNMLGGYYSQQQFLSNLDVRSNMASMTTYRLTFLGAAGTGSIHSRLITQLS